MAIAGTCLAPQHNERSLATAKLIIQRKDCPASRQSPRGHRSWCEDPASTWPHCVISLDDIRLTDRRSAQVRDRLAIREHGKAIQ